MSLVTVISDERGFFAATGSGQLSREGENDRVKIPAFLFLPLRYLFFRLFVPFVTFVSFCTCRINTPAKREIFE